MNKVFLSGKVVRDAETKAYGQDKKMVVFTLAVPTGRFSDYFTIKAFKNLDVVEKLRKGESLLITGDIRYNTWEKDGQKHKDIEIILDSIDKLGVADDGAIEIKEEELPF